MNSNFNNRMASSDEEDDDDLMVDDDERYLDYFLDKSLAERASKSNLIKREVIPSGSSKELEIEFDDDGDEDREIKPNPKLKTVPKFKQAIDDEDGDDNEYEDDDDDDSPPNQILDTLAEVLKANFKRIMITSVIIIFVLSLAVFTKSYNKRQSDDFSVGQSTKNVQQEAQVEKSMPEKEYVNVTQTVWGKDAILDYEETVEVSDTYYTDEMVVTKFQLVDEYSVQYYFSGIPRHFKKKIIFPVSIAEYNNIPSGGKIFIDYKIVRKNGVDCVTDIVTSIKE